VLEDDTSINTETADIKSQQTTVTPLPPPNLKIKVRPTITQRFRELTISLSTARRLLLHAMGRLEVQEHWIQGRRGVAAVHAR
jgi:hypothetical protein